MEKYQELIDQGDIRSAIVEYVRSRDWVTFAELKNRFGKYAEGNVALESTQNPNIIFWVGMSKEFTDDIASLLGTKLFLHPASSFTYMIDGATLDLPLVKRLPKKGYRKPHWLPACLRLVAP